MDFRNPAFDNRRMDVNAGGSFAQGPAEVVVDLTAAEAASGTAKLVAVPPDGMTVMIHFPPGISDGMVQNIGLPAVDPATGATSTRHVSVAVRVSPGGPFPPYAPPGPGYAPPPGFPPPGFASPAPRPRFGPGARVGAVVLGVALVGGIVLVPTLFRGSDAKTTGGTTTATATATAEAIQTEQQAAPTAAPLEPAAFQAALDDTDKKITAEVKKLQQATTPRAVSSAADTLADTVRAEASALSALTAPAAASAAHNDLVSGLNALEDELSEVSSAATGRDVCTGWAANAAISRAEGAADLRTAISALAAADPAAKYRFGSFLSGVSKDQNRRKANGSYLIRTTGGSGQFKIDNGNATDTVINLVKAGSKKPAVSVYVRGKSKVTTGRIKDGTYQVFVSSGADWDGKRFTRDCSYSKFDDSFAFRTTSRQYTIWQITLKPTLGGNARSSSVDPEAFPS